MIAHGANGAQVLKAFDGSRERINGSVDRRSPIRPASRTACDSGMGTSPSAGETRRRNAATGRPSAIDPRLVDPGQEPVPDWIQQGTRLVEVSRLS
ncbi:MAG: hypothetical protein MZU97_24465 [Bacillus subtilis]|nr:hypothetical protein [Bacillus subtilis]